jgi:hypothetical protein
LGKVDSNDASPPAPAPTGTVDSTDASPPPAPTGTVDSTDASPPPVPTGTVESKGSTTIATATGAPFLGLAVDAANVYFTSYTATGTVSQVSLTTGVRVDLATGNNYPIGVVADASHVYWASYEGGTVSRAPIGGGMVESLGTVAYPGDLAFVGNRLFAGTVAGVAEIFPSGAAPSLLYSDFAEGMAASPSAIVWCNFDDGNIFELASAQAAPRVIATGQTSPVYVAVDDTTAYWASSVGENGNAVLSAPLDGGAATVLSSNQRVVGGIVADASGVYWTDMGLGTITRVARGTTSPVVIATGETVPWAITLDPTYIYWTAEDEDGVTGKVRRMPKDAPAATP